MQVLLRLKKLRLQGPILNFQLQKFLLQPKNDTLQILIILQRSRTPRRGLAVQHLRKLPNLLDHFAVRRRSRTAPHRNPVAHRAKDSKLLQKLLGLLALLLVGQSVQSVVVEIRPFLVEFLTVEALPAVARRLRGPVTYFRGNGVGNLRVVEDQVGLGLRPSFRSVPGGARRTLRCQVSVYLGIGQPLLVRLLRATGGCRGVGRSFMRRVRERLKQGRAVDIVAVALGEQTDAGVGLLEGAARAEDAAALRERLLLRVHQHLGYAGH